MLRSGGGQASFTGEHDPLPGALVAVMVQCKRPFCYSLGKPVSHMVMLLLCQNILMLTFVSLVFSTLIPLSYKTFLLRPFHHLHVVLHVVPLSQKMGLGRDAVRNVGMRAVSSTSFKTVC